jgi:hypothetical protein
MTTTPTNIPGTSPYEPIIGFSPAVLKIRRLRALNPKSPLHT